MAAAHSRVPTNAKDDRHSNQVLYGIVWIRGRTGRGHLFDPHAPNCMNFGVQNWLSRAGDIVLQHQKINYNQLRGSNLLRECIARDGQIYLVMKESIWASPFSFIAIKWRYDGYGPGDDIWL